MLKIPNQLRYRKMTKGKMEYFFLSGFYEAEMSDVYIQINVL